MIDSAEIEPVALLILARLLVAKGPGATLATLSKDVGPLLGEGASAPIGRAIEALEQAGRVARSRKGRSTVIGLTDAGRRAVLETLGLEELPPKTTWSKLKSNHLAARALGLPAPKGDAARRFGTAGGFEAAALKARHDLPIGDFPTKAQATDALLWKLLGFATAEKFSVAALKRAVLAREAGEPAPKGDAAAIKRIVAKGVGARRETPTELREAAIRGWAGGGDGEAETPAVATAPARPALDLDGFARRALQAARTCPTGRFGADKVFIAHVWRALRDDPEIGGMGLDEFKRRLAEANQARRLDLSRADLVEAMDPDDVRSSEVAHQGARFHFVRI